MSLKKVTYEELRTCSVPGFVAPLHLRAIKETNKTLLTGFDKFDSVGIIDSYFPNAAFFVEFERARVRWYISLNDEGLPSEVKAKGHRAYRSITVEHEAIEFSNGFTELHTQSYEKIISGNGFGIEDAQKAIEIAHEIRPKRQLD